MSRLFILLISILASIPAFADGAKVSGVTFMHYAFEDADNNEFVIQRAYLTYANKVNDAVSYKFQADVGSDGGLYYTVYLKNAKVDWKTDFGKVTIGLQGMNMFKVQEGTWGYRFIDKTAMDRKKFSSSADLGVGWSNSFGALAASVMLTNGSGYKKAENDGHKKLSIRLHTGDSKLKEGFNAGGVLSYEGVDYDVDSTGSSIIVGGFGGLVAGPLTAGAEYNMRMVSKDVDVNSSLISVYGRFDLGEKLNAFGRLDLYDADTESADDLETYIIAGVNYMAEKGLSIAPNLRMTTPEGGDAALVYHVNFQFKF